MSGQAHQLETATDIDEAPNLHVSVTTFAMSKILTSRQAEELHKSIIAYLSSTNLTKTAAALRGELNIGGSFDEATCKKYEGLLEKKWTSVVRLQKKVGRSLLPVFARRNFWLTSLLSR